jgi:hypothetical protein
MRSPRELKITFLQFIAIKNLKNGILFQILFAENTKY